ncbi:MAG: hypothetical protein KU37_10800 [Sulfuricurvum sp. PC08-66]|nr:MAG: hypothetical protein KU37_10800 [Sulfuricurvum sp. PC08-66]
MLIDVIEVKPKENFVLDLVFENGEKREFDCKALLDKKPFQALNNRDFFNQAKIVLGTVAWSNEIDISPETLYLDSRHIESI